LEELDMASHKPIFSLQNLNHGWWQADLADTDGSQGTTITVSSIPQEPFLPMLRAIRLLLLGSSESACIWWTEPGQYRWHFSRQGARLQIHIHWRGDSRDWSDEQAETILHIECNMLTFTKRFAHQLNQLNYQAQTPVVPQTDLQQLQDAIVAYTQAEPRYR
jgi:hypothetical protein